AQHARAGALGAVGPPSRALQYLSTMSSTTTSATRTVSMASPAVLSVPSPAESICHRPTPGLKNNPSRPAGSYRPDWLSYLDKVMGDGGSEEPAATSGHTGARARAVASWAEIVQLASAAASS